jgi:hypothetical protein
VKGDANFIMVGVFILVGLILLWIESGGDD